MTVEDKLLAIHVTVTAKEVATYCKEHHWCKLYDTQLYVFERRWGQLVDHCGIGSDIDSSGYQLAVRAREYARRKLGLDWQSVIAGPKSW